MTHRAKVWSVAVAALVTLLAAVTFGISAGLVASTVCWFAWSSLQVTASWLFERYRRTRHRPIRRLALATLLAASLGLVGVLFGVRSFFPNSPPIGVFGGVLAGSAWAVAALINFRSFIKGPDAPPPLRWRDLTAPRPQP
jgi:hypothetical protein